MEYWPFRYYMYEIAYEYNSSYYISQYVPMNDIISHFYNLVRLKYNTLAPVCVIRLLFPP